MNAKELGDMPAFPLPVVLDSKGQPMVHPHPYNKGMTVREKLAGMAMQGLLSNLHALFADQWTERDIEDFAVRRADALLALLAKDTE